MNPNKVVEIELNEDELFGYVIDKNKPARTDITDSVILKKIKI